MERTKAIKEEYLKVLKEHEKKINKCFSLANGANDLTKNIERSLEFKLDNHIEDMFHYGEYDQKNFLLDFEKYITKINWYDEYMQKLEKNKNEAKELESVLSKLETVLKRRLAFGFVKKHSNYIKTDDYLFWKKTRTYFGKKFSVKEIEREMKEFKENKMIDKNETVEGLLEKAKVYHKDKKEETNKNDEKEM